MLFFKIYRTDPLSKKVCSECFEDLNKYFDFLHKCVTVQENFRRDLANPNHDDNVQLYLNSLENHKVNIVILLLKVVSTITLKLICNLVR